MLTIEKMVFWQYIFPFIATVFNTGASHSVTSYFKVKINMLEILRKNTGTKFFCTDRVRGARQIKVSSHGIFNPKRTSLSFPVLVALSSFLQFSSVKINGLKFYRLDNKTPFPSAFRWTLLSTCFFFVFFLFYKTLGICFTKFVWCNVSEPITLTFC